MNTRVVYHQRRLTPRRILIAVIYLVVIVGSIVAQIEVDRAAGPSSTESSAAWLGGPGGVLFR
jgi:hypothetical protein